MRPEMGPGDAYDRPDGRYADLLGADAGLAEIVGALDSLYGQGEPPTRLAAEIERAIAARAEQSTAAIQHGGQRDISAGRDRWSVVLPFQGGAGRTGTKGSATMTMTRKRLSTLAAVAAAVVVVGLMALLLRGFGPGSGVGSGGNGPTPAPQSNVFAHSGGVEVVAELHCPGSPPNCSAAEQSHVVAILTQRFSSALTNVPDLAVRPLGASAIVIDIAGLQTAADVLPLLDVGGFAVLDTGPTQLDVGADTSGQTCVTGCQPGQYKVLYTGTDLDTSSIQVELNPADGQPIITFAFKGAARSQFAQYTGSHVGQYLTMVIDNKVVESAVIQSQIDGQGQVSGVGTAQQARNLAVYMRSGALPVALTVVTTQTVPAGGHPSPFAAPCKTPVPFWYPCTPNSTPGSGQSSGPGICATPTVTPIPPASGTTVPNATPGTQASYVQNVTTATGVDSKYMPVNPTSYFPVNSNVYVVASVRNITAGQQHTISIHWFLDNQDLNLASNSGLNRTITQNTNMYFSLTYPTPGLGMAKIYFDRPLNDPASDTAYLAATVDFLIQQPSASLPTPTPAPGAGGGSTCQTPVPAPTTPGGFSPTATPGSGTPTPPPTPTPTPSR